MLRTLVLVASALVLVAVAAWWMRAPQPLQHAPVSPQAAAPTPGKESAIALEPERTEAARFREQATAGPPRGEHSSPELLSPRIDALHAAALAGDRDAMLTVGVALHACLASTRDPTMADAEKQLEIDLMSGRNGKPAPIENQRASYDIYHRAKAAHEDCLRIGHERAATGLSWLERAAHDGDETARIEFARRALDTAAYPSNAALLSDLDEVIRRRNLADRWMAEALERGSRAALAALATFPGDLARNRRANAMYALAWSMTLARESASHRDPERDLDRRMYRYIPELADDAAWATFVEEARRISNRTQPRGG